MPQEKFKYCQLCQWYPATFTVPKSQIFRLVGREVDPVDPAGTVTFNCAEQFMTYCKTARFGDEPRQSRVLGETDPKVQKALGRQTAGFVPESWDEVKCAVVEAGNIAKFGQNVELRKMLLGTGDRQLVEAASKDRVWGIEFCERDALANRANWGGDLLGKALMAAREHLRREETELENDGSRSRNHAINSREGTE